MPGVTVLDRDRVEVATLENAHEISYTNRINEAPTASFALPVDDDKNDFCEIGRYVKLSDNDGKIGLYRINSPRLNTEETQKYYDLFHVIDTLNDQMFPGKSSVNDGLTQLTKSVEEGDTKLPVKDPSQFSAGDTVIIAGRSQSETVTIDSIFGGGNEAKVKMEVRGSIGPISESYKDEDVLKTQNLILQSGVENDYPAGTTVAIPISITDAINAVLNRQEAGNWQLGTCDFSIDDLVFQFYDSTLLDALFRISKKIGEKYVWTWDTDSYPWTLNLKDPVETKPVGYIDREVNLRAIDLKRDPSKMATRLYPYGTDGISIKPVKGKEYIQDDEAVDDWGVRERVVRTNHNTPSALLTAAENILAQRKEPQSTFQISAADLSDITGEDVHKYEIGDWVQITDPENDIKVKEILVSKSKNALQENPAQINLEFANKTQFFKTPDEQLSGFRHDLEGEIEETTNLFDAILANLINDVEDLEEVTDELESAIQRSRSLIDSLQGYLNETRQDMQNDLDILEQTVSGLDSYIDSVEGDLSSELDDVRSDLQNVIGDLDNVKGIVAQHDDFISAITVSPSQINLISNHEDFLSTITVEPDEINLISGHENFISGITVEPNQINLVSEHEDFISAIGVTPGQINLVSEHENFLSGITVEPSQINLVSEHENFLSGITVSSQEINLVSGHENFLSEISVSPSQIDLVSEHEDFISAINITPSQINLVSEHDSFISAIDVSPEQLNLISEHESYLSSINVTPQQINLVSEHENFLSGITVSANDINLVSEHESYLSGITVSPDQINLVSSHENFISKITVNPGQINLVTTNQANISEMKQSPSEFEFNIYTSKEEIVSYLNVSRSGISIHGDNIDISGSDITVSGDQITLSGSTNVEGGYDAFNVDNTVWLKGGYATWPLTIPNQDIDDANFGVKQDGTVIAKEIKQMESENGDTIVDDGDYLKPSAGYLENQIIWDHDIDGQSPANDFEPIDLSYIVGLQEALLVIYADYLDSGWNSCIEILPRERSWVRTPGGCGPARGTGHAQIGSANEREILITTTDKDGKIAFGSLDAHNIDLYLQFWIPLGNVS